MNDKTRELAIMLFRNYILAKCVKNEKNKLGCMLEVALIALSISSKLEEERVIDLRTIMIEVNLANTSIVRKT
jgi:hypothetical protein